MKRNKRLWNHHLHLHPKNITTHRNKKTSSTPNPIQARCEKKLVNKNFTKEFEGAQGSSWWVFILWWENLSPSLHPPTVFPTVGPSGALEVQTSFAIIFVSFRFFLKRVSPIFFSVRVFRHHPKRVFQTISKWWKEDFLGYYPWEIWGINPRSFGFKESPKYPCNDEKSSPEKSSTGDRWKLVLLHGKVWEEGVETRKSDQELPNRKWWAFWKKETKNRTFRNNTFDLSTLPETNVAPETQWLKDSFPLGKACFQVLY